MFRKEGLEMSNSLSPFEDLKNITILEKLREFTVGLSLINAALYLSTATLWVSRIQIFPVSTPWGDASFIILTLIVLALFGISNGIIIFFAELIRKIIIIKLFVRISIYMNASWTKNSLDKNRVLIHRVDSYLNIHEDKPLQRAYDKKLAHLNIKEKNQENSTVTLVLLAVQRFTPDSLLQQVISEFPWLNSVTIFISFILFMIAILPISPDEYDIYLPGHKITQNEDK